MPSPFQSADILSTINKSGGFSRPHHFEALIFPPQGKINVDGTDLRRLSMNCSSVSLPGKSIATKELTTGGFLTKKIPHSPQFSDLSVNFYLSSDLLEKSIMDAWQSMIHEDIFGNLSYYEDYIGTIIIHKFKRNSFEPVNSFRFLEVYPLVVGDIEQSYDQMNSISILPVTFAYHYWEEWNGS